MHANKKIRKLINGVILLILTTSTLYGCGGSAPEAPAASAAPAAPSAAASEASSSTQNEENTNEGYGKKEMELEDAQFHSAPFNRADDVIGGSSTKYSDGANLHAGEKYLDIEENEEKQVEKEPLMTFSLKVDTASYSNVERLINNGTKPQIDAVKIEEMINYFNYESLLLFNNKDPFSIYTEIGPSMLNDDKYMAFVRVKSKEIDKEQLPKSSLTFLIDTSGSMDSHDKLPLLKEAFELLCDNLSEGDIVSIVTYAGNAGVVLDGVDGSDRKTIIKAINNLRASGSTAGGQGIMLAYHIAEQNFIEGGNNRIILATDGDFNVGISTTEELARLVEEKRDNGIYLSVLGFGMGNIRDDIMETLSKNGNGNYSYINNLNTANKVLVEELGSNLFTIAQDVKAQVEFNPANIESYRLIGYENRRLNNEDFNNDRIDAGEIGIGTDVVMMFEFSLKNQSLKYEAGGAATEKPGKYADELFEVRLRYKNPGDNESNLMLIPVQNSQIKDFNSNDFNFAQSVAAFGHILRDSQYMGKADLNQIRNVALDSLGSDNGGYRIGFVELIDIYSSFR